MLILKRMQLFNEVEKCDASGKLLYWGDYYYEDTNTGKKIDAKYYRQLQQEQREALADDGTREYFENDREYQESLREQEMEILSNKLLNKDTFKYNGIHLGDDNKIDETE